MYSRCPEPRHRSTGATLALPLAIAIGLPLGLAGCEREARRLEVPPSAPLAAPRGVGVLYPGPSASAAVQAVAADPLVRGERVEENAYAVSQGKRWFRWFNCSGCHGGGGGGNMGPPLSDDRWLYGHELPQVVASILQGRPNGMPAFAGRVSEEQAWQLAAYVRSLSGQLRSDVAGGRSDAMGSGEPEQRRELEAPRPDAAPPTVR